MSKDLTQALAKPCYCCGNLLDRIAAWEYIRPDTNALRPGPYICRPCRAAMWKPAESHGYYGIIYPDKYDPDMILTAAEQERYCGFIGPKWTIGFRGILTQAPHLLPNTKEIHGTCYICGESYRVQQDSWLAVPDVLIHRACEHLVRWSENWFSGTVKEPAPMNLDSWYSYIGVDAFKYLLRDSNPAYHEALDKLDRAWARDRRVCKPMSEGDWRRYTGLNYIKELWRFWEEMDRSQDLYDEEYYAKLIWEEKGGMKQEDWERYTGLNIEEIKRTMD